MYQAIALLASEQEELKIQRRTLRDSTNVLELPDSEFVQNFRVNKEIFQCIFEDVQIYMKETHYRTHLPPQLKLSTFLRFLATGSYQKSLGNESVSYMAQSTVAKVIDECLCIFENHFCRKWVNFQRSDEEERAVKEHFYSKFGIPGVIGCVDGTHVRIKSPSPDLRHLYHNRKGFYSLNVLAICDHKMVITFIDARHPGANHDSFIWKHSEAERHLRTLFENGKTNFWLLGDSGYPLQPYLMTPFRTPSTAYQIRYNELHCKARNIIERCFGVLKNRFRCVLGSRGLHYSPEKAIQIINVCSAIHNVCISFNHDPPMSFNNSFLEERYDNPLSNEETSTIASNIRRQIAESLFS